MDVTFYFERALRCPGWFDWIRFSQVKGLRWGFVSECLWVTTWVELVETWWGHVSRVQPCPQPGLTPDALCRIEAQTDISQPIKFRHVLQTCLSTSVFNRSVLIFGWRVIRQGVAPLFAFGISLGINQACGRELQLQTSCFECLPVCLFTCVHAFLPARAPPENCTDQRWCANLLRLPRMIHQENSASSMRHWRWVDERTPLNGKSLIVKV